MELTPSSRLKASIRTSWSFPFCIWLQIGKIRKLIRCWMKNKHKIDSINIMWVINLGCPWSPMGHLAKSPWWLLPHAVPHRKLHEGIFVIVLFHLELFEGNGQVSCASYSTNKFVFHSLTYFEECIFLLLMERGHLFKNISRIWSLGEVYISTTSPTLRKICKEEEEEAKWT